MAQHPYTLYAGFSLTIPNDNANHQLLALLLAVDSKISPRTHYLTIQNDPDNSNDSLLIGSAPTDDQGATSPEALSAVNFGVKLVLGASETFMGFRDEDFPISRYWLRTNGTGTCSINVQVVRG